MIRDFTEHDIPKFKEIKILSYIKKDSTVKEYLLIQRKPFISCFIVIDNLYGIFIEQYRPVIRQKTFEIPMGKIEAFDNTSIDALIRELKEECNLNINPQPTLSVKHPENNSIKQLVFKSHSLKQKESNYLSPGFSNSKQYPFILELQTVSGNFLQELGEYQLFSQEEPLSVYIQKLEPSLIEKLNGISRYDLISFLYEKTLN